MELLKAGKKIKYFSDFMVLDTETSHTEEIGWINSIQIIDFCNNYIQLRKPSELCAYLKKIRDNLHISANEYMVIYVHNLSYDLTYFDQWLFHSLGVPSDEMGELYTAAHKIIYKRYNGFEFRCSYRLSGKSLDKWSKDLQTKHRKAVGTYDYTKLIYQDSEISETESNYDKLDVIVLKECLLKQMAIYGDSVASIPYTSTGYVRRDIKKKYQAVGVENSRKVRSRNYFEFKSKKLTVQCYKDIIAAKNGGITHGNRFLMGKTIQIKEGQKGRHVDLISAYPSADVCYPMPCGRWFESHRSFKTIDEVLSFTDQFCLLVTIILKDVHIKDGITLPFLQSYKCTIGKYKGFASLDDNGRVLHTVGATQITVSDLMLHILQDQYNFKYQIVRVQMSKKYMLPYYIIDATKQYFFNKTKYKDIAKKYDKMYGYNDQRTSEAHITLLENKKLLNAIFGVNFEDPVKDLYEYDYYLNEFNLTNRHRTDADIEEQLEQHYSNRSKFNRIEFGMYTTEVVKFQIYEAVKMIGYDHFIYADTDSIFYIEDETNKDVLPKMNQKLRAIAAERDGFIEYEGEKTWFNGFDYEEDFKTFKFLHAKCYALTTENDEFILTIAGVPQTNGKDEKDKDFCTREMELCGFDDFKKWKQNKDFSKGYENFREGFVFKKCGSTTAVYTQEEPHIELINGHMTEVANACIIEKSTKTLHNSDQMELDDWLELLLIKKKEGRL